MTDTGRRAVLIAGVVAVLVGLGLAGTSGGRGAPVADQSPPVSASVSATGVPAPHSQSSAWFCVGGTGAGGNARAGVVFANPTAKAVPGTFTAVPSSPGTQSMAVTANAGTQVGFTPAEQSAAAAVASTVVFDGGGVGVWQFISGTLGPSAAPCASATASQWYFADGSTSAGNSVALSLFNPTQTIAVVDVSFVTAAGLLAPPAYQGIDVPAGSLAVENVGDHVQNTAHFATVVSSLSGAVVAAQLQSRTGANGGGVSVELGARAPGPLWSFPQNIETAHGSTVFHVFNPSKEPARVTVDLDLAQGQAEPLVLAVPAGSVVSLDAKRVTRIPAATAFAATFVAAGGGIVVDRQVSSAVGTQPPQEGDTMGVPGGAERWLVPAPTAPLTGVEAMTVLNLTPAPLSVQFRQYSGGRLVPVPGVGTKTVGPGVPLTLAAGPGSSLGTVPWEVVASGPVALETDVLPAGSPGVSVMPALALP